MCTIKQSNWRHKSLPNYNYTNGCRVWHSLRECLRVSVSACRQCADLRPQISAVSTQSPQLVHGCANEFIVHPVIRKALRCQYLETVTNFSPKWKDDYTHLDDWNPEAMLH